MRKYASINFDEQYAYMSSESIHKKGLLYITPPFIKVKWKVLSIDDKYNFITQLLEASNSTEYYKKETIFEKRCLKFLALTHGSNLMNEQNIAV